jgi:hypothetical protein
VLLAGDGVALRVVGGAGVAEERDKDVGQKVAEQFLFLEAVGVRRFEEVGPFGEEAAIVGDALGGIERVEPRAEDVGAEEGLAFERQGTAPQMGE